MRSALRYPFSFIKPKLGWDLKAPKPMVSAEASYHFTVEVRPQRNSNRPQTNKLKHQKRWFCKGLPIILPLRSDLKGDLKVDLKGPKPMVLPEASYRITFEVRPQSSKHLWFSQRLPIILPLRFDLKAPNTYGFARGFLSYYLCGPTSKLQTPMALGDSGWLWVALGGYGWLWVALGGSGWLWVVLGASG